VAEIGLVDTLTFLQASFSAWLIFFRRGPAIPKQMPDALLVMNPPMNWVEASIILGGDVNSRHGAPRKNI